ncbi:DUF4268 domain-containing protein [Flammeovirga kamogawensis]|uniref:DUF4268 domain-containing protein n=1 Tax=Flammeovirga kamogawensis TaxID=373891 RepID=A0ABX8GRF9_9BACT|nr:DUF4268 domain-containing protein [Flammeovirga kamogawensis]MBB6464016.1 hypothetical protein [Flammeovirga kamogawensis]QWG06106.1 DUF4268 domain-containing protein [Flammeovirga kamogawensis]TRX67938.1 DUF4268 domain-containing protein [Flammeovirga kamogawensis]
MFSKEEASKIRSEFWTKFGKMMAPHRSQGGAKVNWTNYKTGVKNIYFKMDVDSKKASIGIYLTHKDVEIQEIYFQQFVDMKDYMQSILNEKWEWELNSRNEIGQVVSKIYIEKHGLNMFRKDNWADIYQFLQPRILKLDEFWDDTKEVFKSLA